MSNKDNTLIVIAGATAVGKTAFAVQLAKELHTEILSADSRQFYKETVIGTAAPSPEEQEDVVHHFIGHLSIFDYYNVGIYEQDALNLLDELFQKHQYVILAGGSGLYIDAVCSGIDMLPDIDIRIRKKLEERLNTDGLLPLLKELQTLDEEYYHIVDKQNPKRILRALEVCLQTNQTYTSLRMQTVKERSFNIIRICLDLPRSELYSRINLRTDKMIQNGLLNEAETLFPHRGLNALNAVGYPELFGYIEGKYSLDICIDKIKTRTRRYAKRQKTWFGRYGNYTYFEPFQYEEVMTFILNRN
jgi:tRNA dimethylallyltransferase